MLTVAVPPGWQAAAPTKSKPPAHADGSRTSIATEAIYAAAKTLDMVPTDPTKVVKALTKFAQDNQSCGLVDPAKRDVFFAWFHKYMHHSYMQYLETAK